MIRIYERVSTKGQKTDSQRGDLERWAEYQQKEGHEVVWYTDKSTGKNLERPAFKRMMSEAKAGDTVAVWRLDRLGRTGVGLTNLFDTWERSGINFYSLRDSFDLSTPAGRLMRGVLISVAVYETEVRAERVAKAREARKARGETPKQPGPPKGKRLKVTPEQETAIRKMKAEKEPIAAIARATGLTRPTVYSILAS